MRRLGYEQYKNPVTREYKGKKYKKRWWYLPNSEVLFPSEEYRQDILLSEEEKQAQAVLEAEQEMQAQAILEAELEYENAYAEACAEHELASSEEYDHELFTMTKEEYENYVDSLDFVGVNKREHKASSEFEN